jgi:hypothetical protein
LKILGVALESLQSVELMDFNSSLLLIVLTKVSPLEQCMPVLCFCKLVSQDLMTLALRQSLSTQVLCFLPAAHLVEFLNLKLRRHVSGRLASLLAEGLTRCAQRQNRVPRGGGRVRSSKKSRGVFLGSNQYNSCTVSSQDRRTLSEWVESQSI